MEAPIAGGHPGALPIQGQGGRREWRKVTDPANGRERIGSDHGRANPASRPRSGHIGQRRSSRNGRIFHPGSSEHSSDSDNHGGDGSGGHMMGGPVSPQELINQSIGHEDEAALYDEVDDLSPILTLPNKVPRKSAVSTSTLFQKAKTIRPC